MKLFLLILLIPLILRSEVSDSVLAPSLSFLIPGGGQFYNNEYIKGSIYSGFELGFGYGIYYSVDKIDFYKDEKNRLLSDDPLYDSKRNFYKNSIKKYRRERNSYIWLTITTILISAGDAFVSTKFKQFSKRVDDGEGIDLGLKQNGIFLTYNF
jgi:TM2 domain-containing membrane protein YozV